MSDGLNKVMLLGNLGADPEYQVTRGGQGVLKIRLATTTSYRSGNEWKEQTEWHRVTVWGKRGEALSKILHKGDKIFVEGRISTSSYEKNGEKRYSTEVVAENVILGGGGRGSGAPRGSAPSSASSGDDFAGAEEEPAAAGGTSGGAGQGTDDIPF